MKKHKTSATRSVSSTNRSTPLLIAYYATLVLFILFSFASEYRVWAFNWWAYYPFWLKLVLVAIGAIAPPLALRFLNTPATESTTDPGDDRRYWLIAGSVIGVLLVLFIVLRARMYFLGDGYLLLGGLATQHVIARAWTAVGDQMRQVVFGLLSGDADEKALLTYRLISWVSGAATLVTFAFLARNLATGTSRRLLVFLSLATGGYALMFFGYVENYPPFIFTVGLYLLIALLVTQQKISGYWIFLPLALAGMTHVFAVALIPPTIYLFLHRPPLARWYASISAKSRRALLVLIIIGGIVTLVAAYINALAVRYTLVPVIPNEATVDRYTFFSPAHLLDWVNLVIVLMPGILVAGIVLIESRAPRPADLFMRIVGLTAIVSLVMTLIFNPSLSMPRDWDLFAFAGVPLVLWLTMLLVQQGRFAVVAMSIVLALLVLLPRAGANTSWQMSINHFRTYAELNPIMNRSGRYRLMQLYQQKRDTVTARAEEADIKAKYPAYDYQFQAEYLLNHGQPREALSMAKQALAADGRTFYAYIVAARASMDIGDIAGAQRYVDIGNALNPGNAEGLQTLGGIQCATGDFERGLATLYRARDIKDSASQVTNDIAQLSLARGDLPAASREIQRMIKDTTAPARFFAELATSLLRVKNPQAAKVVWQEAQRRGLDSLTTSRILSAFPQLAN